MLLPIHIVAGGLAILLGAVALLASKGGWLHRRSGLLFVGAMLTMGVSGSILALRLSLTNSSVLGGFVSAYFVLTSLTTVRPASAWTRRLNLGALVLALAIVLAQVALGIKALTSPHGMLPEGVPYFVLFSMATITLMAAVGDVRVIRSGLRTGGARLGRHLWRMCFALFIAASSFFSIRARVARVLPAPFTTPAMRALPVALVFVAMFYWLWRVRGGRGPALRVRDTHTDVAVSGAR